MSYKSLTLLFDKIKTRKLQMHHQLSTGLYTDFYELTMAQGYFLEGRHDQLATFDYFFRRNPFGGGFVIFSGLEEFLQQLQNFKYSEEDLEYLSTQGFQPLFLDYLKRFRFQGEIVSCREGEVVFPQEPVMRVNGTIIETQLIESLLLNIINFSSLISTKAIRMRKEAGDRSLVDFGLRRAQGTASMYAARSAYIGGGSSSSHVLAGKEYDVPVGGTMAHSWIQSFDTELEAFRAFANLYPTNCILLIDTYDTLKSGLKNALIIASELKEMGYSLKGIRLDSGDLAYLSKKARKALDDQGFYDVSIVVSNQLDEYLIRSLNLQKAPIDVFGVGTSLVTGAPDAALDGVYKMSEYSNTPRLKVSDDVTKLSLPGKKNVIRFYDHENHFYADAVILEQEDHVDLMIHPHHKDRSCELHAYESERLLKPVVSNGQKVMPESSLNEIAAYARDRFALLDESVIRLENPHIYKVGLSRRLLELRDSIAFDKQKNGG